ncbi:MAG: ankyrin repeat domain-containing protein [Oligoflexia bacterium]|nr:ankyrin repeat domain-containing protein [Oligoflexia bacterium]
MGIFKIFTITLIIFIFTIGKNIFAGVDPNLLKGLDLLEMEKGKEYLHPLNGVLLLQGMISNIFNYSVLDKKGRAVYPSEEFVRHVFNTAESDIPNYLKVTTLASNFGPFLSVSTVGAILKVLIDADLNNIQESKKEKLTNKLIEAISKDSGHKERVQSAKEQITGVEKLLRECMDKYNKNVSRISKETTKEKECVEKKDNDYVISNLARAVTKKLIPVECEDQGNQFKYLLVRMGYKDESLKSFVRKLTKSWFYERSKNAKYPKHFTEQILLSLAWLIDDTDGLGGAKSNDGKKKQILELYANLGLFKNKGNNVVDFSQEKYDEKDYYKIQDAESYNKLLNDFEKKKSQLAFFTIAQPLYDFSIAPEIGYKAVEYQIKNSIPPRKVRFADCMESSILNFLAIVFRKGEGIDFEFLNKFKIHPQLREFFEQHKSITDLTNNNTTHDDWVKLMEQVPGVIYVNKDKDVGEGYEVKAVLSNFFLLIEHLFFWNGKNKPFKGLENHSQKMDKLCEMFSRDGFKLDWNLISAAKEDLKKQEKEIIKFKINNVDAFTWRLLKKHSEIKRTTTNQTSFQRRKLFSHIIKKSNKNLDIISENFKLLVLSSDKSKMSEVLKLAKTKSQKRLLQYLIPQIDFEDKTHLLKAIIDSESGRNMHLLVKKIVKTFPPEDYYSKLSLLEAYLQKQEEFKKEIENLLKKIGNDYTLLINDSAERGFINIVNFFIIKNGVTVGNNNSMIFYKAAENGHIDILKLLIKKKNFDPASNGNAAFRWAAQKGQLEVLKFLINKKGVNPVVDDNYAFRYAAQEGHLDVLEFLIDKPGVNPAAGKNFAFRMAVYGGYLDVVKFLINKNGVDPAAENNYALVMATKKSNLKMLKFLLSDSRVDPHAGENILINYVKEIKDEELWQLILKHPKTKKERLCKKKDCSIL